MPASKEEKTQGREEIKKKLAIIFTAHGITARFDDVVKDTQDGTKTFVGIVVDDYKIYTQVMIRMMDAGIANYVEYPKHDAEPIIIPFDSDRLLNLEPLKTGDSAEDAKTREKLNNRRLAKMEAYVSTSKQREK